MGDQPATDDPHASADAHAGGGHGDGHAVEALGPVDIATWGLALLGVALGLAVALAFVAAAS